MPDCSTATLYMWESLSESMPQFVAINFESSSTLNHKGVIRAVISMRKTTHAAQGRQRWYYPPQP